MLEAKGIHKVYHSGVKDIRVLSGLDLAVARGKFVAITGPSGAGKSTLLHILGGLDKPTSGAVFLEGQNINKLEEAALCKIRNKKIGFVFQFYHLMPEFTVLENILMPVLADCGMISGSRPAKEAQNSELKERAVELLRQTGLSERARHFPSELSGGEKQRVAIARALINKPEVLFCDEPTGNLDSKTGGEIIALIQRANIENKMTVILVTHNLDLTKAAACLYHLKDGVLIN